ncbi:ABC transporter permease [Corynebacterium provencense]|nr:ABC transporter permease subunit [Corynebacterium provencense]
MDIHNRELGKTTFAERRHHLRIQNNDGIIHRSLSVINPSKILWIVLIGALFILLIWPLIMLIIGAFRTASPLVGGGGWSTAAFGKMWAEINVNNALSNSIIYSAATTVFGVSIAVILAYISQRTNSPLRRLVTPIVIVTVSTSALFYAVSYRLLANEHTGILNAAWKNITGSQSALINIETLPGLIFIESIHSAAFVYLFLVGPMRALGRDIEDAALAAGASQIRVFFTITLRMLTPILTSVVLIGLISGLQSFTIPFLIGGEAKISFISVRIYNVLQRDSPPAYADAAALAVLLLSIILVLAALQAALLHGRKFTSVHGRSSSFTPINLRRWKPFSAAVICIYALFSLVLPLTSVIVASFQPFPGVFTNFSARNYQDLFANPDFISIIVRTAAVSAVGAVLATTLAFIIAYLSARSTPLRRTIIRAATLVPLAMPGIVGAIAVIWAFTIVPGLRQLYGSTALLIIGMIIAVLAVLVQISSGAVSQIGRELEDAARVAGARTTTVIRDITARLLLPNFASGTFLAGVLIMGNLEVPLLLSPPGTQLVATQTTALNLGGQQAQAAALLTVVIALIAVIGVLIWSVRVLLNRHIRRRRATPELTLTTDR